MVGLKGEKGKRKEQISFLPLDDMSRTPKGEINFCIYKLLRVSSHFAPVALRF